MGKGRAHQSVWKKTKKKKVAEGESELEWQFVVFFVRSAAFDLKITFILSMFIPGMLVIPDTFPSLDAKLSLLLTFQVSNEKRERLAKMFLTRIF